ncbi:DNA-binding transcriptional regulator, LysR family [Thermomonospora echinospora]|uniref:DNA-binding transcriptional regulator, LysR family n=1 Tax=Thermomonospora echinospora TaxID=1992 RepID=A0A1H6C9W3_9ACTN|nr:LysR family transcriptional regulator [Thermomonospora echinospora]SEG69789.1 DNA-binding transcriptional regulator, LysR family [Thermomonospora echinospora]
MTRMDLRELECFLVLSRELHFGRTAERLYLSQSRVSQLLRSLEHRVGAPLVERTSRRVRLTPLGERFLEDVRPAFESLHEAMERARAAARGVDGTLRVGFVGTPNAAVMGTVLAFQEGGHGTEVEVVELPLADPFGQVRSGEVDAAFVCLPVAEPGLVVGPTFPAQPVTVAVSRTHPLAGRAAVHVEELADHPLIQIADPAPRYWAEIFSPAVTPAGRPIPRGPVVATLQEALTMIAAGRGGLLFCASTAAYHCRPDTTFVPVEGLPESRFGVVWRCAGENARIRALACAATAAATNSA